jgi:hypothetical protein
VGFGRRIRQLATGLAAAVLASGLAATPVSASCIPPRNPPPEDSAARYVITSSMLTGVNGLQATISHYDPYLTGHNGTGTNMSLMLLSRHATDSWAQWGWLKGTINTGSITRETWYQLWIDGSHYINQFFGPEPSGSNSYRLLYNAASGYYYFYRNNTIIDYQPRSYVPNAYQIFGETHDVWDQMPGGASSKAQFLSTQYRVGTTWSYVNTSINPDPLFGGTHPSTGRYDIWDNRCTF